MKVKLSDITYDDVQSVIKSTTLREYLEVKKLSDILDKFLDNDFDGNLNDVTKLLYIYKLGFIQGKRNERLRKKNLTRRCLL